MSQDLGLDGDTLYVSNLLGTRVVRFRIPDTRSVADVVQQLSTDARVQVAQPNYVFTANGAAAANRCLCRNTRRRNCISTEAHKIASGKRIKIAVIDTAIDATPSGVRRRHRRDVRCAGRNQRRRRTARHLDCRHRRGARRIARRRA